MKKFRNYSTSLENPELFEAESLEQKLRRVSATGEPIEAEVDLIFQERSDGIDASCDIRTDRFDMALEAADSITKSYLAMREKKTEVVKPEDANEVTYITE